MTAPLRIFLVDDHPLMLAGVRTCLEAIGHAISGQATSPCTALQQLSHRPSDLIITDVRMGNSSASELLIALQERAITLPCIVLSMHCEPAYVQRVMSLGARGYVRKDDPIETLLQAVHRVAIEGRTFLSPHLQPSMEWMRERPRLSPKEIEVLQLLARDHNSHAIAQMLGTSVRTVESHRLRLRRKLHLEGSSSLQHYAQNYADLELHAISNKPSMHA